MSRPEGVLFDLDGVLFDTEPLHRKAWIATMRGFGHEIGEESLLRWTGIPCIDLAEHYERTLSPGRDRTEYHDRKGDAFRSIVRAELGAFPGLLEAIARIRESCEVGFVTSNDRRDALLMLEVAGYAPLFRVGVAYEDVALHKPDPAPYLEAARLLGADPRRCIAVEDSPSGVASAHSALMRVAAVTTSFDAADLPGAHRSFGETLGACEWILALLSS